MKKKILLVTTVLSLFFVLPVQNEAATILEASYVTDTFLIDGNLNEAAWNNSQIYTKTFESASTTVEANIYLAHDNSFFYVALETPFYSGMDSLSNVLIDGNHDHIITALPSSPYYDVVGCQASPNGWSGYDSYWNGHEGVVTPPTGYESASYGTDMVSYEYKFPIYDLTDSTDNTIGIIFFIQSMANKDSQYLYPITDLMKTSDPNWLDPWADVGAWADLTFKSSPTVPVPASILLFGSSLTIIGGIRIRRK